MMQGLKPVHHMMERVLELGGVPMVSGKRCSECRFVRGSTLNRGLAVLTHKYTHTHAVGGIYTVIRSKAAVTTAELGDQYCLIGPYNESCVRLEVEVMEPELSVMKEAVEALRKEGIKVRNLSISAL